MTKATEQDLVIYFMQPINGGPIKIGYSKNVRARQRRLEAHYGRSLVVLSTMPGKQQRERKIHEQFDHLRFGQSEQFRPAADLIAFIGCPVIPLSPDTILKMVPPKHYLSVSTREANRLSPVTLTFIDFDGAKRICVPHNECSVSQASWHLSTVRNDADFDLHVAAHLENHSRDDLQRSLPFLLPPASRRDPQLN